VQAESCEGSTLALAGSAGVALPSLSERERHDDSDRLDLDDAYETHRMCVSLRMRGLQAELELCINREAMS
jgi:hypothetical protein